jgi:hypothetical protein
VHYRKGQFLGENGDAQVCKIPLNVDFKNKLHFKLDIFQNGVRPDVLSHGFSLGGGFPTEQFSPEWW